MLQAQNEIIDGQEFQLLPIDVMTVIVLEKKLIPLILPVVSAIKSFEGDSLDEVLDLEKLTEQMGTAIRNLPDQDFTNLVNTVLTHTTVIIPGRGNYNGASQEGRSVFSGRSLLLYKLVIAALRFNKFIPFALGGDGLGMLGILTSPKPTEQPSATGVKLER